LRIYVFACCHFAVDGEHGADAFGSGGELQALLFGIQAQGLAEPGELDQYALAVADGAALRQELRGEGRIL
jgi:hypothetical protein